ncbi:MAG: hypothetical protein JXB04_00310 [Kiritimatiellae bacterium]|nr:hypothetical protein [Kiritimatiellia bacterium]
MRLLRAPEAYRTALAAWLTEWYLDRILVEQSKPREGQPVASTGKNAADREGPGEPPGLGQIRLLQPRLPATRERPRYVAVLETYADGSCLIAPFSRFSIPATTDELITGEIALPVQVLCLWNARRVPAATVSDSWSVGALSAGVLDDAAAVRKSLASGTTPTAPLAARTGPPLRHPLDPRMEYLEEERAWMDEIMGASGQGARQPLRYERRDPADLLKAAEDKSTYSAGPGAEPSAEPPDKESNADPGENPPGGG